MRSELKARLIDIALFRLKRSVNENGLFCDRIIQKEDGFEKVGVSLRYSIWSLIGLIKAQRKGYDITIDLDLAFATLSEHEGYLRVGDYGNMLWLAGLANEKRTVDKTFRKVEKDWLNHNISYGTTSLAWLLTGLCMSYPLIDSKSEVEKIIRNIVKLLNNNFNNETRLFCASSHKSKNKIVQKVNNNIGSFADQVYSIYGLISYFKLFRDEKVKPIIAKCADKICELQGSKGQWWWIYNATHGTVAEKYPVYSVHQDGMAPMALLEAADIVGNDYRENIDKGLDWLMGENELCQSLVNFNNKIIWRSIQRKRNSNINIGILGVGCGGLGTLARINVLFSAFAGKTLSKSRLDYGSKNFRVDLETRPYHYGWILNAFC